MCITRFNLVENHKEIHVWKVLKIASTWVGDGDPLGKLTTIKREYLTSPYFDFEWEKGKKKTAIGEIKEDDGGLGPGFFHTFPTVEDALVECANIQIWRNGEKLVVGRFTIPETATVYEGIYGNSTHISYASTELVYDGILEDFSRDEMFAIIDLYDEVGCLWYRKATNAEEALESLKNDLSEFSIKYRSAEIRKKVVEYYIWKEEFKTRKGYVFDT